MIRDSQAVENTELLLFSTLGIFRSADPGNSNRSFLTEQQSLTASKERSQQPKSKESKKLVLMPKILPKEQNILLASHSPGLLHLSMPRVLLLSWWAQTSTSLVTQPAAGSLCRDSRHFWFYRHKIKCQSWTPGTLPHQNPTPPWTGLGSTMHFGHVRRQFISTQESGNIFKDDANAWLLQFELNYLPKPELNGPDLYSMSVVRNGRISATCLQLCLRWAAWTAKIN